MALISISIPLVISFFIGYFLLRLILGKNQSLNPLFSFSLAYGLGLGTSAYLTFLSFLFFNQFNRPFIIAIHIAVLTALFIKWFRGSKQGKIPLSNLKLSSKDLILMTTLAAILLPLWLYASYYPYGGWDAWSCWNLKARFLYLGQEHWQNMFDPILWRSSPHYPLILPFIHVWGWSFLPIPIEQVPMINSILFTVLTAGLLMSALKSSIPPVISILAGLLFLTLPFYVKLAISQYSDIVMGYFILATLLCLIQSKSQGSESWAVLAGLFVGFLSFTKPEGTIASAIIFVLTFPHFLWKKNKSTDGSKLIKGFLSGAAVSLIPTVLFQFIYSPGNQTFINGLTSSEHPGDFYRFKFIFAYFTAELASEKWHWIWGLLGLGIIFGGRQGFRRQVVILPLFLLSYLGIIIAYYFINTYFKIEWWMQVTLNRILFSLLPILIFWIFDTLWGQEKNSK